VAGSCEHGNDPSDSSGIGTQPVNKIYSYKSVMRFIDMLVRLTENEGPRFETRLGN